MGEAYNDVGEGKWAVEIWMNNIESHCGGRATKGRIKDADRDTKCSAAVNMCCVPYEIQRALPQHSQALTCIPLKKRCAVCVKGWYENQKVKCSASMAKKIDDKKRNRTENETGQRVNEGEGKKW